MVDLIGFAHTPFQRGAERGVEALMAEVAREAIADAAIDAHEVDAVVVSHFNHGMTRQGFTAGLVGGLLPGLRASRAPARAAVPPCIRPCTW